MPPRITDFRHLPARIDPAPPAAHRLAAFFRELVEAATVYPAGTPFLSAVRCVGRVGRRRCQARVHVALVEDGLEWACPACRDDGYVTDFAGTSSDLSGNEPRGDTVLWGFLDEERALLLDAALRIPVVHAVIARARPDDDDPDLLLLRATVEELDAVYTLVEELTDWTRSRKRIEVLDGLRASLCASMDSADYPPGSE